MHEFSLDYLRCVRCHSKMQLETLEQSSEIDEGFLYCKKCDMLYPIISQIPIIWDDFSKYLSSRKILSGKLYRCAKTQQMKKFLRRSLCGIRYVDDRTTLEERWSRIYQNSRHSKFYSVVKEAISQKHKLGLEYGCSIGLVTSHMADRCRHVFGVDRSFSALSVAKKSSKRNLDYFVADLLSPIFGRQNFDLIVALNVLELVEPKEMLGHISRQMSWGQIVISDPYDFERGPNSVKTPLDEKSLRELIQRLGFRILSKTKKPSFHPWTLRLNPRATLNYKVDLIVAKKSKIK